jgi:hypothetical protein
MLLDMISGIELELRDHLGEQLIGFGISVLQKALAYGPLKRDPEWFNDDENFSFVMQQTLQLQHAVVTQIQKLNVDAPELNLKGWKCVSARRTHDHHRVPCESDVDRRAFGLTLCRLTGNARVLLLAGWCYHRLSGNHSMHETLFIDLRDSHLTKGEAVELAELMSLNPKLTSLDVRGNESMGIEGAEALAKFIEGSSTTVGTVARSVCGVTPSKSSLEVPRTLGPIAARLLAAELRTFVFAEGVSAGMGMATRKDKPATLNRRGAFAANDWNALLWSAKENHVEMATCLLALGMDINEQQPVTTSSSKFAALHVAAQKGNEETIKLLLAKGADKSLRDKHNNTALMLAEKKKYDACIVLLGGEPDARGNKLSA